MPPINGLSRIVQILQSKVSDRKKIAVKTNSASTSSRTNKQATKTEQTSLAELERRVVERLKSISDDNANTNYMARHFVESILTWEFGDEILQDPTFSDLSQEIVESFKANNKVWQKVEIILYDLRTK